MFRYSLGLIKPDGIRCGLVNDILHDIESSQFKIIATKRIRLCQADVDVLYGICRGSDFYDELVSFMLSGDCLVFIVGGDQAINRLNTLVGATINPAAGTLRNKYGSSTLQNALHATTNVETFWKEMYQLFTPEEVQKLQVNG